jgi:hypothetical protein
MDDIKFIEISYGLDFRRIFVRFLEAAGDICVFKNVKTVLGPSQLPLE